MKYCVFLALIAFIYSFNCKAEYISERFEGSYSKFLLWSSCGCITGTTSLIDESQERCYCYLKQELKNCESDSRCKLFVYTGCANK